MARGVHRCEELPIFSLVACVISGIGGSIDWVISRRDTYERGRWGCMAWGTFCDYYCVAVPDRVPVCLPLETSVLQFDHKRISEGYFRGFTTEPLHEPPTKLLVIPHIPQGKLKIQKPDRTHASIPTDQNQDKVQGKNTTVTAFFFSAV